ncbi:MAG: DUF1844 domain-containing protein [Candidatus Riflebacteria bacterium]|nr:DUF1844 domain-containing protein [Candidatus Riflebacteria bacterium]
MADENAAQNQELMLELIAMLAQNGWIFMGKRVNPATNKQEAHLEVAKHFIDMLGALEDRTRGRLSTPEKSFLENELVNLRLTYIAETKNQPPPEPGKEAAADA